MSPLIPAEFKKFVMGTIKNNEKVYRIKRGEEIEVLPEFAKLLVIQQCHQVYWKLSKSEI